MVVSQQGKHNVVGRRQWRSPTQENAGPPSVYQNGDLLVLAPESETSNSVFGSSRRSGLFEANAHGVHEEPRLLEALFFPSLSDSRCTATSAAVTGEFPKPAAKRPRTPRTVPKCAVSCPHSRSSYLCLDQKQVPKMALKMSNHAGYRR